MFSRVRKFRAVQYAFSSQRTFRIDRSGKVYAFGILPIRLLFIKLMTVDRCKTLQIEQSRLRPDSGIVEPRSEIKRFECFISEQFPNKSITKLVAQRAPRRRHREPQRFSNYNVCPKASPRPGGGWRGASNSSILPSQTSSAITCNRPTLPIKISNSSFVMI